MRPFESPSHDKSAASIAQVDSLNLESSASKLSEGDGAQRWQDASSWLTSLVLHLTCFLLITSISVPWIADRGGAGSSQALTLTMGFSESDQETDGQAPAVEVTPSPTAETNKVEAEQSAIQPTRPEPVVKEQVQEQPEQRSPSRPPSDVQVKQPPRSMYEKWLAQRMKEPVVIDSSSKYAAILNRKKNTPTSKAVTAQMDHANVASAEMLNPEQLRYDKVVDDFIQYDIGKLRGKAGQAARKRFMSLGVDSIPALVRGLNKSAGIHASCPVGVIAGKLIQMLRGASDPSMRQYAVDNIGRGVPDDAPHFHRIMALRRRWLGNTDEVPDVVVAIVSQQTLQDDGQLLELVLALQDSPIDTLMAALDSEDPTLCNAAMIALTQGRSRMPAHHRTKLIAALTRIAQNPTNSQQASLVEEAMAAVRSRI